MSTDRPFSGSRLLGYRHARKFTQEHLGLLVKRSRYTIKGYERNDRTPPPDVEIGLCVALGAASDALRARFGDPAADYCDAVSDATGTRLDHAAVTGAAAVINHAGRVRGRITGTPPDYVRAVVDAAPAPSAEMLDRIAGLLPFGKSAPNRGAA